VRGFVSGAVATSDRARDVVIESHTETSPSLRIDKPFPTLLQAARALDFSSMDMTDHAHVPYVYILVRALDDWKAAVGHPFPHRSRPV
jgi:amyloid beta precursor protein binding protein 1